MRKLVAAAAAAVLSSGALAADPSVSCTAQVTNCAAVLDTLYLPEETHWQSNTAWWTQLDQSVTVSLGGLYTLFEVGVTVDNNDDYRIERSLDGDSWTLLGSINRNEGNVGVFPGGVDYFDGFEDPDNVDYTPGLDFAPVNAAFLRVSATGGDGSYSVGDVFVWMAPAPAVPEPATWALMGLGVAALLARRRAPQR